MIVAAAARLPTRAASWSEPVTASVNAAPAEKLSPAPQISTGFASPGSPTQLFAVLFHYQDPFRSVGHQQRSSLDVPLQRRVVDSPKKTLTGLVRLLPVRLHNDASELLRAPPGVHPEYLPGRLRGEVRKRLSHRGRHRSALIGLRLIRHHHHVESGRRLFQALHNGGVQSLRRGFRIYEIDPRAILLFGLRIDEFGVGVGLKFAGFGQKSGLNAALAQRLPEFPPVAIGAHASQHRDPAGPERHQIARYRPARSRRHADPDYSDSRDSRFPRRLRQSRIIAAPPVEADIAGNQDRQAMKLLQDLGSGHRFSISVRLRAGTVARCSPRR